MMIFKGRNRVTSGFRLSARPNHNGIDLVGDDDKTVHAVAGGTVGFAGAVSKSAGGLTWQWGYYVRIDGNDGRKYYYCHLAAGSLRVRAGQRVQAGTALGTMGNTGYSFGAHTHFEVRNAYGTPIDPAGYAGVRNAVGTYTDTTDKEDDMKFLQVTSGKCEVFTAPDVNAVDKSYNGGKLIEGTCCALPGFVDSKNEEKTERNAGYLVVSHSGGGMLRQGTRKGIRRTPANRGMRAHWVVKGLDISEDVCHGMCP